MIFIKETCIGYEEMFGGQGMGNKWGRVFWEENKIRLRCVGTNRGRLMWEEFIHIRQLRGKVLKVTGEPSSYITWLRKE